MKISPILTLALACTNLANAVELHHVTVKTGTEGLVMVPLTITNADAAGGLSCNADFAHWYSAAVATVEPGAIARVELWLDRKTGTFTLLNDKRENLPVERLWCGLSGRAYATRSQIALHPAEEARTVACAMVGTDLTCR